MKTEPKNKNTLPEKTKTYYEKAVRRVEEPERLRFGKWKFYAEGWFELYNDLPERLRIAKSFSHVVANLPVHADGDDLLVGQLHNCYDRPRPGLEWFNTESYAIEKVNEEMPELLRLTGVSEDVKGTGVWISNFGCAGGHIAWHWDWIVDEGVEGILRRVDEAWGTVDDHGRLFLQGIRECMDGFLKWTDRHVEALREKLSVVTTVAEKKQLEGHIERCERVPRLGARNFREAVQTFHFVYLVSLFENPSGGNSPGRFDYYLWPYLERDLNEGRETLQSAGEVIDELLIRFHERHLFGNHGGVETIVVGGCREDGSDAMNPLARIVIESFSSLDITHPAVYLRMAKDATEEQWDLAVDYLRNGQNRAQILNDEAIISAMTANGVEEEDARMYMCGGCMEISPHGMNSDYLFTGFFNTAKVLEMVLTGGICMVTGLNLVPSLNGKTLVNYKSFEELYTAFENELRRILTMTFRNMDLQSEIVVKRRPAFFMSSQIEDCIRKGRAMLEGGAKYEFFGSTPLGIPNLGDSLYAIKTAVYDEKFISAEKLLKALQNDFENDEALRKRLLSIPKFGQGDEQADKMVDRVVESVCAIYSSYTNHLGGGVKAMIMTFQMAPVAGAALGATPDGRNSGTPVSQGVTPQGSSMTKGITTAMRSASSVDISRFAGGASHMWDLSSDLAKPKNIKSLLKVFFASGGQMFQGNMVGVEELLKAKDDPEAYQQLIVRVGGFSGKFVTLDPTVQNEIIARQAYSDKA